MLRNTISMFCAKVKLAEERGAVGVIIYNDPLDYAPSGLSNATYEDTFPNGPYLPPSGAQRGSLFGALSGDPLTPGFPSKGEITLEGLLDDIHFYAFHLASNWQIIQDL